MGFFFCVVVVAMTTSCELCVLIDKSTFFFIHYRERIK